MKSIETTLRDALGLAEHNKIGGYGTRLGRTQRKIRQGGYLESGDAGRAADKFNVGDILLADIGRLEETLNLRDHTLKLLRIERLKLRTRDEAYRYLENEKRIRQFTERLH